VLNKAFQYLPLNDWVKLKHSTESPSELDAASFHPQFFELQGLPFQSEKGAMKIDLLSLFGQCLL
jgi:hypothetical protein